MKNHKLISLINLEISQIQSSIKKILVYYGSKPDGIDLSEDQVRKLMNAIEYFEKLRLNH